LDTEVAECAQITIRAGKLVLKRFVLAVPELVAGIHGAGVLVVAVLLLATLAGTVLTVVLRCARIAVLAGCGRLGSLGLEDACEILVALVLGAGVAIVALHGRSGLALALRVASILLATLVVDSTLVAIVAVLDLHGLLATIHLVAVRVGAHVAGAWQLLALAVTSGTLVVFRAGIFVVALRPILLGLGHTTASTWVTDTKSAW